MIRRATTSPSAADFLPPTLDLKELAAAAECCQGCELYKNATHTVFGEGPVKASVFMIGEQPGDQEDLAARPFVGPAGRLLDDVLADVGLPREDVYLTNMVKHFKWEPRGTRRLHAKPTAREVGACRPWLEAELKAVQPMIIVCLGATAAQGLLGSAFRITRQRGEFMSSPWAETVMATYHPSAILRAPDAQTRQQMHGDFVADLQQVANRLLLSRIPNRTVEQA